MRGAGQMLLFALLSLTVSTALGQPNPPKALPPDEQDRALLQGLRIGSSGPELLARLKNQAGDPKAMAKARELLPRLGSENFDTREQASRDLALLGAGVLELLRENSNHPDPEIARRIRDAREAIEETRSSAVLGAVIRQLIRAKVPGTAQALVDLAAGSGDLETLDLIRRGLEPLAATDSGVLQQAMRHENPRVRWVAGCVLAASPNQIDLAKPLLRDPDHSVRWRIALALGRAGDQTSALPAAVAELRSANRLAGFELEDWLHQVAGETGPAPLPWPGNEAGRAIRQKTWQEWLATRPKPAPQPDRTLTVLLDEGIIRLLDKANQPLWELKDIAFPLDAAYLPGGRILVAEHGANRVTIRSNRNEVLWERQVETPLAAQRTNRGTILITTADMVLEVDGEGAERRRLVAAGPRDNDSTTIMKSQMLPSGELGLVTQRRELGEETRFVRFDRDWREAGSIPARVGTSGGRIEWFADGRVLVPELDRNRVAEYDAAGKELWAADAEVPVFATRTASGSTLITSRSDAGAREVDRAGKTIWNYKAESRVTRAIRLP